jgi:hypothetical protein
MRAKRPSGLHAAMLSGPLGGRRLAKILRTQANLWFVGANIPGKARFLLTSPVSTPVMRAKRAQVAAKGYAGFLLQ